MKWGNFIARTAVRRVVYIIVGAIIAAAITWATPAQAQEVGTRQWAVAQCNARLAQPVHPNYEPINARCVDNDNGTSGSVVCYSGARDRSNGAEGAGPNALCGYGESPRGPYIWNWSGTCPADQPWNPVTATCGTPPNPCADKPDMPGTASRGDVGGFCAGGCGYVVNTDKPFRVIGHGTPERTTFGTFAATGSQCTVDDPIDSYDPNRSICNTVTTNNNGSVSQCVRPDGMTCVAMGGSRLCYNPGETGDRMTTDGKLATNRVNEGETPKPPANQQSPQHVTTTTTTVNNNTTVTSVFAGGGASPGQGNVGAGGKDGSADGNGNGEGDGDGEDDGPGGVGGDVGTLYEGSGKTLGGVYEDFKAQAMQAPILASAAGFFSAPSGGGACPVWTIPPSDWIQEALVFDFFCAPELDLLLVMAGWVLMTLAAYKAWTIFAGH